MPRSRFLQLVLAGAVVTAVSPAPDVSAQWRDALKVGKSVASRPKFTDEDEGRMAQAQAQKFDAAHKMWPEPLLETYLTGMVQKLVGVAKPRPFPYRCAWSTTRA